MNRFQIEAPQITIDKLQGRAEAAEARCAELEALILITDPHEIWQFHVEAGRKAGLMDMRERAAKLAENDWEQAEVADAIRALLLNTEDQT